MSESMCDNNVKKCRRYSKIEDVKILDLLSQTKDFKTFGETSCGKSSRREICLKIEAGKV